MATTRDVRSLLDPPAEFARRHLGPSEADIADMLGRLGLSSLDALADEAVPEAIRLGRALDLPAAASEADLLEEMAHMAGRNPVWRSYIGLGYHGTVVPPVVQRNIFENPGWYTQYTPYQAEISQGRLEMLLNFQTMVADLTGLEVANASLLDEATAAAEAMTLVRRVNRRSKSARFAVSDACHPQTLAVLETRARPLGIEFVVDAPQRLLSHGDLFGVMIQSPDTWGRITDYRDLATATHDAGALIVVATDLLALTLLTPPGEMGADIAVGNSQRFGVPLGYGGPHAAFFATRDTHKRQVPGRIVGVSRDSWGEVALRLALQTREQHIRRERATSNICTAQVLLAVMAAAYAVYHGPSGLRRIAERVHASTEVLRAGLRSLGHRVAEGPVFDTLRVEADRAQASALHQHATACCINLRSTDPDAFGISLDETVRPSDIADLLALFGGDESLDIQSLATSVELDYPAELTRKSPYLTHPTFNRYHSETEMLRYLTKLQSRDLSLTTSMIPLGSCTMKLNATAEMMPVTLAGFSQVHPFAPREQTPGYAALIDTLEGMLSEITGFPAISFMPNAGSQGEYTGLLVIHAWHEANGHADRQVCLIPQSAHGTNPASAIMAGMRVVVVACDDLGNIDLDDLRAKAAQHADELAAIMITYPSTHGVFEARVREACDVVHEHGGQVYLDGANLNAQVGLCRPADYGADVCHLNLHKTFAIPHGGGGPGMGPIGVAAHLAPFLPAHPLVKTGGEQAIGPVSAAPFGSPSILPISWMYARLLGADGAKRASQVAILNANYMAARLSGEYPIVYTGENGRVAHEFILDCRAFEKSAGVRVEDIAKRLMDYGFHAPTMSWPIPGTLMVEPTESESRAELDRFCDAMIAIRGEIACVESGEWPQDDNPLVNAPHPARALAVDDWPHPYSREQAAYPAAWSREHKYWPPLGRIDNAYGDRNLVCACPPIEAFVDACDPNR